MYGITRVDHAASSTHQWRVTIQRRHQKVIRPFSDGRYGGRAKALEAAIRFRDRVVKELTPFTRQEVCSRLRRNNRTGVSGVTRIEQYEMNRGRKLLRVYWMAQWPVGNGRARMRKFSVRRYGEDEARFLALMTRKRALRSLDRVHAHTSPATLGRV